MTPEEYIAKTIKDRGVKLVFVAERTGIKYSRLQPTLSGNREFRADEYLALCDLLNCDPRGYRDEQSA